jgi:hypothetical protein
MTRMGWCMTCVIVLSGCKSPVSYKRSKVVQVRLELSLGGRNIRNALVELEIPDGFERADARSTDTWSHDAFFARPHDRVDFRIVRRSPFGDLGTFDHQTCGLDASHYADKTVRAVHEVGPDGSEVELCGWEGLRGPSRYWVRKFIPVDNNWIECEGEMPGVTRDEGGPSQHNDASGYTEAQRLEVLDVCRSMRVVRVDPPQVDMGEHERRLREKNLEPSPPDPATGSGR